MGILTRTVEQTWLVLGQMSPYLLFGFLIAGVLSVCVSPAWVERRLGRPGWGSVLKASLFGIPLPLCSCGVIPVSASIYRHGASRSATTAFLLSTPQTGVDSIAVTYVLLGPVFAVYRPVAALLTGLLGGGLVQAFVRDQSDKAAQEPAPGNTCQEACCSTSGPRNPLLRILQYGLITLPRDIGGALILGALIAGVMSAVVPKDRLADYIGSGILSILAMMALGVPVYVCATASVPIAAGLMHMGASPGAALAFLIAGPATNAAAFTTLWKLLGRRTALLYLLTVAIGAIVGGLVLDFIYESLPYQLVAEHDHGAAAGYGWTTHVWAVALLIVMILSSKTMARFLRGIRLMEKEDQADERSPASERLDLLVGGMTCSHCAESVRQALSQCEGVTRVEVDLAAGCARVEGDSLDHQQLLTAISALGYSTNLPENL